MNQPMIDVQSVSKRYKRGGETLVVLDELDLSMDEGGFYALMGPSGSGKSTLLNLIGGLDQADGGAIIVDGEDVGALEGAELSQWRADTIGFVFQGFNLIPVLTAQENVELPLSLAPIGRGQRRENAAYALELVGMSDRATHRPKATLRRPGAARRHRTRDRHGPQDHPRRRADRRPRP